MSILENLKKTAGQIANKTSEVVKDASDSTKLRLSISTKKKEIQEKYIALGKKVFEDFEAGTLTDDSFAEDVNAIKNFKAEILSLQSELEQVTSVGVHLKETGESVVDKLKEKAQDTYVSAKDFVGEKVEDAKGYFEKKEESLDEITDAPAEEKHGWDEKLKEKFESVKESLKEKFTEAKEEVETWDDKAQDKIEEVKDYWQKESAVVEDKLEETVQETTEVVEETIEEDL